MCVDCNILKYCNQCRTSNESERCIECQYIVGCNGCSYCVNCNYCSYCEFCYKCYNCKNNIQVSHCRDFNKNPMRYVTQLIDIDQITFYWLKCNFIQMISRSISGGIDIKLISEFPDEYKFLIKSS